MSRRRISRTRAMGLRRDPHPPMPIVIPLSMVATASSMLNRLSDIPAPSRDRR